MKSSVAVVVYKKFCEVVFFFGVCKRRILENFFFFFFGFCFASRTESLDRGFACLVS